MKLLDGTFRPPQFLRDFANAPLLNEAPHDHQPLIVGQHIHQLTNQRSTLGVVVGAGLVQILCRDFLPGAGALPVIRNQVRRDSQ